MRWVTLGMLAFLVAFVGMIFATSCEARAQTAQHPSATAGNCAICPAACSQDVSACTTGNAPACALANACLCQCKLNAGGCGNSISQLQQCVQSSAAQAGVQIYTLPTPCAPEQKICVDATSGADLCVDASADCP